MKIEHIALYADDPETLRDFYIRYFGAEVTDPPYRNPKSGLRTYFLRFDEGARLELMCRPDTIRVDKSPLRTGYIHVAFAVGSEQRVDELTSRLVRDGFRLLSGPRRTGDGYYESVVLDPEENIVEITA